MPRLDNQKPSQSGLSEPDQNDRELIKLVEVAAEGEGNPTALKKIQALPRDEVITALSRIREGLEKDDRLRVKIAFIFCYLDHEYSSHRAVIISAFSRASRYKGFYADDAVVMIDSLISRGDKELLKIVFEYTGGADTAVAEGIMTIFGKQIRSDPENFVTSLKDQKPQIRREVYRLLEWSDMPEDQLDTFRNYLMTAPTKTQTHQVTKELLKLLEKKARH